MAAPLCSRPPRGLTDAPVRERSERSATRPSRPSSSTPWSRPRRGHPLVDPGLANKYGSARPPSLRSGGLRTEAVAPGQFQDLARPGPHREGEGPRGPLYQPSRCGGGVRRRREAADTGARPHRTDAADATDDTAAGHHDYERNGTVDLFAALDIARGTVITDIRKTTHRTTLWPF